MFGARLRIIAAIVFVALCAALIVLLSRLTVSVDEQHRALRRHFRLGEYAAVLALAQPMLDGETLSDDAAIMAGESAAKEGQLDLALVFYQKVEATAEEYPTAQLALGEVQRELGQISKAESAYLNVLDRLPGHQFAHSRIAFLRMVSGRAAEAVPHLKKLLELRMITWTELGWLALPERRVNVDGFLEKCRKLAPDDPAPIIGLAMQKISRVKYEEAIELLEQIDAGSDFSDRKDILLLQCRLQTSQHATVPPDALQRFERFRAAKNYEGLFALGEVLEVNGFLEDAILSFSQCVSVTDHLAATQHLLSLLSRTQPNLELDSLRHRITLLSRLDSIVKALLPDVMNAEAANEISTIMTGLGRQEEAVAWRAVAQRSGLSESQAGPLSADIHDIVQRCIDLQPTLSMNTDAKEIADPLPEQRVLPQKVLMTDEAANVGIDFTYFECPDETTPGRRMIESTGGGVGVLDFDNDTWPDLHWTQGTDWPVRKGALKWLDAVHRNLRGLRFVDVAVLSGLIETGFSQGIACGDLNNDGFTDVVVANIGDNSYWLNQGDGTFVEFLPIIDLNVAPFVWTSSCAVADLNADGLPDIFEVNYVTGDQLDSLICQTIAGPRVCSPLAFDPTIDRLLLNRGDGTFVDATKAAGINMPGNGLGIVVTNLDRDPLLEVFVANDAMPNALWDNTATAGEQPRFIEVAVVRGAAVSGEGLAQACMGVAPDDFNGDGTTDLFVTNYFNEPNAVYVFDRDGFAIDDTLRNGIRRISMAMLGFGVQSLDANGDKKPDVFVVNGDVDDFSHEERSFRMPPQLMINTDHDVFREEPDTSENDVRKTRFRGRGAARCDWNSDGRWDIAVSCLDEPARLVTLKTPSEDRMALVKIVGTTQSRDAIGLHVTDSGGRMQVLHAGSGYMASNQNSMLWPQAELLTLQFGEAAEFVVKLKEQPFQVIIEGRADPYAIPK